MPAKPTRIIFRKMNDDGEILALFPDLPGTNDLKTCLCYAHIGQHSTADYRGMIHASTQATSEEYSDLLQELEKTGYTAQPATPRVQRRHFSPADPHTPKYRYLLVLQGLYAPGQWEDIHEWPRTNENRKDARADLKAYRANTPEYSYRIIGRREKTGV